MPAMLDEWVEVVRDGVHNAATSLRNVAPETTDMAMPSLRTLSKIAFGGAQVVLGGGRIALEGETFRGTQ